MEEFYRWYCRPRGRGRGGERRSLRLDPAPAGSRPKSRTPGDYGEQTGLSLGLAWVRRICIQTHEYQGVHILVMPLDEFSFGRFAVAPVKFSTKILRRFFLGCGV